MSHTILVIIFSSLIFFGLISVVLPFLPGLSLMFVFSLIFGFIDKFEYLTTIKLLILGGITLVSIIIDYLSGFISSKYLGATKYGIFGGVLGFLLGTVILPPFGGILGLFLGILFAEIVYGTKKKQAVKIATGSLLGTVGGILINLLLGVIFLVLFVIFAS